jgi:glutaryl-CoA dehydrogenase
VTHALQLCDPLGVEALLTDEERLVRDAAAAFTDREVLPHIEKWFEAAHAPRELVPKLAALGAFGATLEGYGCAGMGQVAWGLLLAELERGDSAIRSLVSVQSSLCMGPIHAFGTEAQKERWLPRMARGETLGCFCLTEPGAGSDPASMKTTARRDPGSGDGWRIEGTKLWISSATYADLAVVWAKAEGEVRAFLVEKGEFTAREIPQRMSFRTSSVGEVSFQGARAEALPFALGLRAALKTLNNARAGIAFAVTGAAAACFAAARDWARERVSFGRPIAARQLVQARLAEMATQVGLSQLLGVHLMRAREAGRATPAQVSFAKRHNVRAALEVARTAREILGANGITLAYPVVRHMLNLESVYTYEGTDDVHTLVMGREITGLDAMTG